VQTVISHFGRRLFLRLIARSFMGMEENALLIYSYGICISSFLWLCSPNCTSDKKEKIAEEYVHAYTGNNNKCFMYCMTRHDRAPPHFLSSFASRSSRGQFPTDTQTVLRWVESQSECRDGVDVLIPCLCFILRRSQAACDRSFPEHLHQSRLASSGSAFPLGILVLLPNKAPSPCQSSLQPTKPDVIGRCSLDSIDQPIHPTL
jgi:hypothetical protein